MLWGNLFDQISSTTCLLAFHLLLLADCFHHLLGKIRKPLFLHFDTFEAKKVIRVKFVFEKAAMNYSGNGTDLDDVDGRLNVTPSTLVRRDRDFYVVVASILIASGVVPNLFIVVQILR